VAGGWAPPELQQLVPMLQRHQADWAHAVRLLVIGDQAPAGLPVQHFALGPDSQARQAVN
jgi:hypothetical protein